MKTLVPPAFVGLLSSVTILAADPLETWELRSPKPTPNPIRDIAFGNGLWVGVGDSGTVITSTDDGQSWALQDAGVTDVNVWFSGIVFTNNLFVAVGSSGLLATSPNGTNWTLRTAGNPNNQWNAVTYGGGRYVAVGQDTAALGTNNIALSTDGTNWTTLASGFLGYFNDVTYAQGIYVAVGGSTSYSGGALYTSPNGTNWSMRVTNFFVNLSGITYGNGKFVAVGNNGTALSSDGTTWTLLTNSVAGSRIGVTYGNGLYVSVGASAPYYVDGVSYTSSDGTNWYFHYLSSSETVRFANGRFAAVGAPTTPLVQLLASVHFSSDGTNWSDLGDTGLGGAFLAAASWERWRSLVYGNGQFAFIPDDSSVRLTTNFVNFTLPYAAFGLRTLAFGNNQFVAVANNTYSQTFASSANSWTPSGYASGIIYALCYTNSLWVGVGKDGYIATSSDAMSWTDVSSGVTNQLNAVAAGSGVFVAVGENGIVATSPDGTSWSSQSLGATNELRAVAYGRGLFVTVGFGGKIFTSINGTSWITRSSGTFLSLNAVCYCFGRFVVVGDGGLVISSPDGVTWSRAPALFDQNLLAVAASPAQVVAVGAGGVFQTSPDGLNWESGSGFSAGGIWKAIYYNGQFIGAMDYGVALSAAGRSWQFKSMMAPIKSVLGANGLIIAAGGDYIDHNMIEVSGDNGVTWWSTNLLLPGDTLNGLAYGNGTYVAVGLSGSACSSIDASNWVARSSGTGSSLNDVAFGNNAFVAVISGSTNVLRSTDGTTWATQSTALTGTYKSIVFRDGLFYAAGTSIVTSADGISWMDRGSPSSGGLNGFDKRPGGKYAACGPGGTLLVSSNLTSWTTIYTGTLEDFNSVTFGSDTFVAVGRGGMIYQSDFLTNTPVSIVKPPASISVLAGGSSTLSVQVTGRSPFSYQWFKDGMLISGAISNTLTLNSAGASIEGKYHVVVNNDISSQTSADATVTTLVISVMVQPDNLYAFIGGNATFTVSVVGATPLSYQWHRSYVGPIIGETNATLTISNAQPEDADSYAVAVTFAQGQVMSDYAYFSVLSSLDEVYLYTDPSYVQVPNGGTALINAYIQGPTPLAYQWTVNGTNIMGATNATLVITNAQFSDAGLYSYIATFTLGTVTNADSPATLEVYYAEPPIITGAHLTSPGNFRISFTGLTNRYYQVDYATNLAPPVYWDYYDSLQLKTNPAVFNVQVPLFYTGERGYFRIQILPP